MPDDIATAIDLPFKEAIDFFRQKARVPTSDWTGVWRTAHSHSFMVAGATSDALLGDFQKAIQKALDKGTTLAEFRKDFDGIVERHGWAYNGTPSWRSRIIYETNLSTAYSAGRYAQMTEPGALAVYPYWQYVHSGSRHPRPQHLAWNGLTLRADDPFWAAHYPPNGWRCGCRVKPVSDRGLRRMGKTAPDASPPTATRPWRNPHTGEVHQVPVGIDPGFDYNPGMAWKQGGASIPVKSPDLNPVGRQAASPEKIAKWVQEPVGDLPVGDLSTQTQAILDTTADSVVLSPDTMEKQLLRHPEMTVDDYAALPAVLSQPDAVVQRHDGDQERGFLAAINGRTMWAWVKVTKKADEAYVVSYYRARPKAVRAAMRKMRLLAGSFDRLLAGK